jgi:hypothetical protein
MDKAILGDNQFFAVNHQSDEKSRAQMARFKKDEAIMKVLDDAIDAGIETFMCTTHDRIGNLCKVMRANPERYKNFKIYPCMPYAHKYANSMTENGIVGTLKEYMPGNSIFGALAKGGMAVLSKDFIKMMEMLVDAELKMFQGIQTPVIFLQNVVVDMLLGLRMPVIFKEYDRYIREKYHAEPGYITMNLPLLLDTLESQGITNPVVSSSVNKLGFRMAGDCQKYEDCLKNRKVRLIAMQTLAAGSLKPKEAFDYVGGLPSVIAILFGASSKAHISENKALIESKLRATA